MEVSVEIEKPEDVLVTITCTMPLADWSRVDHALREGLRGNWHSSVNNFAGAIRRAHCRFRSQVIEGKAEVE